MNRESKIGPHEDAFASDTARGLNVRTYIATQAMVGLLAGGVPIGDGDLVAGGAVELADALIAELNK